MNVAGKPLIEAAWRDLPGWGDDDLAPALQSFLDSCKTLKQAPWLDACADAAKQIGTGRDGLKRFFETRFVPYQVVNADGSREGVVTGYYEPLLKGSRRKSKAYPWPLYGVPDDLVDVELDTPAETKNGRLRGRLENRKLVPYYTREEIGQREKQFSRYVLLWIADPIELFFLHVQGSGRIELEDGSHLRVAYADTNGHPYKSIGRWLVDKGELKLDQASMDGIKAWARANPSRLNELLNVNPSYIFFRIAGDASGDGPQGSLGVPLTPGRSIAVDPRSVPLGAPVWLATTQPNSPKPLNRLVNAQDTGSAIKGGVRADYFWGFGAEAGVAAGRMRQSGTMWVLMPREAVVR